MGRQAEDRDDRTHLRLLVEATPSAIVMIDDRGNIALTNARAQQLFGYPSAELLGRPVDALVPTRFRSAKPATCAECFSTPNEHAAGRRSELFGLRKDGVEVAIEIGLSPITTPEGAFTFASIVDVTDHGGAEELRLANAGMQRRTDDLESINAELESFSYSVSHDLRAPLRAVIGYARAIQEDYGPQLDDEGRRLLSVVNDEAMRMGALIDDLLAFSRLGRQTMESAPVNMMRLARDVFAEQTSSPDQPQPNFEISELPAVRGDLVLLRQVWANLISNAIKFSSKRSDPHVRVWGAPDGDRMIYHVGDNGAGFDMRYADKLFGVFQRLHRTDEFPGTGVGLGIVQRIVNRHGGTVWADAKLGAGATFSFALPGGISK